MAAVGDVVREAFRTEERGIDWRSALVGAVVAIGPLAVGLAMDELQAGLTATIGGLNTALCVPRAGARARWLWGTLAALGSGASLALADLVGSHTWSVVPATLVWVGIWGILRAAGPSGALVGFATCAVFTIFAGIPLGDVGLDQLLMWHAFGAVPALVFMAAVRRGPAPPPRLARHVLHMVREAARHDRALREHVVRLGVAVAAGTLLYRAIDLPHGYWVALTTLAILQPGEHATQLRAVQRAAGTLGGAALILLVTLVTEDRWALVACAGVSAFWLYALDERGYFWLVVMLTPTALLMLSVVEFEGEAIVEERVANSMLGILIGLLIGEAVWRLSRGASAKPSTG